MNYLDARADPRNTRQNYRRMTASWRMKKYWTGSSDHRFTLGGSIDYTGSFDRIKSDRDIDIGQTGQPMERYRADYSSLAAALNFTAEATRAAALFRRFEFTASVDADFDITDRWRYVVASANVPIRTALEEGSTMRRSFPLALRSDPAHRKQTLLRLCQGDGALRKATREGPLYAAPRNGLVDGQELRRRAALRHHAPLLRADEHPPAALRRPAGPAPPCGFAEATAALRPGRWRIDAMAGVRATTMANLGKRYTLQGYVYPDPRVNLSVGLPTFEVAGHAMRITLSGGTGWHTKTPTLDQLFPDPVYFDYTQLNYFPEDPAKRRIQMVVYRYDPTNYDLRAARNFKWEVRGRAEWNDFDLSLAWFREEMTSGFRTSTQVLAYSYLDYDETAIDASTLTGPPLGRGACCHGADRAGHGGPHDQRQPHAQEGRGVHLLDPAHPAAGHETLRLGGLVPHRIREQRTAVHRHKRGTGRRQAPIPISDSTPRRSASTTRFSIRTFCSTRRFPGWG